MLALARWLVLTLPSLSTATALVEHPQHILSSDPQTERRSWRERPHDDATGHLIFHQLSSLLQMGSNSKYHNGHGIVRATMPAGTVLYHGRGTDLPPTEPDWLAVDPEHSFGFSRGGTHFTYMTTRVLNLVYFDGASANKIDGTANTQDILFWASIAKNPDHSIDRQRIIDGCKLAKEYGIDGYIRMEMDFELMYCDFNQGVELVSAIPSLSGSRGAPSSLDIGKATPLEAAPLQRRPPLSTPKGWKGSMQFGIPSEGFHSGHWHNEFPGEVRIHADPTTLVTLFDLTFTSLIPERRGKPRTDYRLGNISRADAVRAQREFLDAMSRPRVEVSGVDWIALVHSITERFSDRLPFLRDLLHSGTGYANATAHATAVRKHVGISVLPYMSREGIDEFDSWIADMAYGCATTFTSRLPAHLMTKQERVLHVAVGEVLHEICRVITFVWSEAFDVEDQEVAVSAARLARWKDEVDTLVKWLDWPVWTNCDPACSVSEYCHYPQNGPYERGFPKRPTLEPYCISMEGSRAVWG